MTKNKKLCLLWQNKTTRQWYHVGNLLYNEENHYYQFSYELEKKRRGLKEALENGYQPHIAFQDLDKTYVSNKLFLPFARRVPNINRPDYDAFLKKNGLTRNSTTMEILKATGGRLATDNYEFVNPIIFDDKNIVYKVEFFARGWRYYEGQKLMEQRSWDLKPVDLTFKIDKENPQDDCAVAIFIDNVKVGYVPAFYSAFFKDMIEKEQLFVVSDLSLDKNNIPQLRLLLKIQGHMTNGNTQKGFKEHFLLPV